MSVKLIVLKTGEQLISDVKEYVDESERVHSVLFVKPMLVDLLTPDLLVEGSGNSEDIVEHKVAFFPWLPLSKDVEFMISPDYIASICNPLEWVKESYENRMKGDDPNAYGEPVEDEVMIDTTLDSIEVTGELLNE